MKSVSISWRREDNGILENLKSSPIKNINIEASVLTIVLENKGYFQIWDNGQSCCESRWMDCDDPLEQYIGATIIDIEEREYDSVEENYGVHDVMFVVIKTNRGNITLQTHNEHNGYYGGFHCIIQEL